MADIANKEKIAAPIPTTPTIVDGETMMDSANSFYTRNKSIVNYVGAGVLAIVAGAIAWFSYMDTQNKEAQGQMFQAIYYFEADSLKKAINGDGNQPGFLAIADEFAGTKAANLAHYYLGAAYLKDGKFQEAADELDKFSASDYLVQGRAYCLQGDAYSELGDLDNAAKYYSKAAAYNPNKYYTPGYLMKLAIVQEAQKDYKGAAESYDKIITKFYESQERTEAQKFKARAEGLAGGE